MKIETTLTPRRTRQRITGLPNSALVLKAVVDDRKKAGYRLVAIKPPDRGRRHCDVEFERIVR